MKAGLRKFGCDDAPDQPDRKTEMLGEYRPDQIAPRNEFARGLPAVMAANTARSCGRNLHPPSH
jgi:hypothetical protein